MQIIKMFINAYKNKIYNDKTIKTHKLQSWRINYGNQLSDKEIIVF